ncbi:ABC transporter ATP-binding protein [archaeon]|nr:ABC transporter ATP-binding protein [archaeon]MBT4351638.1 ABC transporter ATP-binding protein [archaeon]MBT4647381.1 ABC transporter ATP-binding protein [archaeon]MBT6821384.1 ABC transporter ATP-binding protein [archaeon]MBT7392837.1 ABC transporter ATP-binding protein [archaeon]
MIETKKLSKHYGNVVAINNINLDVSFGELFGLLGPNGSGKTTIIKILTGQVKPTTGTGKILGMNILENPIEIRKNVGIIPEQETPPSFLTAEEYLYFVAKIRKIDNVDKKIDFWFDFLNFKDRKKFLCKDLSRGTRQKLMVAQAFLHEPKLAFIDEPLINLDPIIQRKVKDYFIKYVKEGNTIFFSSHVLEIAQEICTRVSIIEKGNLIYDGKINDMKKNKINLEKLFLKRVQQ